METKITDRDKKLLYILGFIVILFIFGWVIMRPMIKSINKTEESIAAAENLKQQNEFKVTGLSSAKTLLERFKTDMDDSMTDYYEPMDSSEIDKLITSYVLGKGLYAKDLTITMPKAPVEEMPYLFSEEAAEAARRKAEADERAFYEDTEDSLSQDSALGTLIELTESPLEVYTNARDEAADTVSSGVYCVAVKVVMTGSPDKEQALLDDIMYKPSIRLTGFSWDEVAPVAVVDDEGVTEIIKSSDKQLTVMLNLYMYDKESAGMAPIDDED